jgi:mannose-6-phosphate isomerase-like protein (cupin superfamily)
MPRLVWWPLVVTAGVMFVAGFAAGRAGRSPEPAAASTAPESSSAKNAQPSAGSRTLEEGGPKGERGSMSATIVNIPRVTPADLPPAPQGKAMQTKMLATDDGAAVQVQLGTVGKHYHTNSDEIQYIVEGEGKFWLGDSYRDIAPGDLIFIPKGTPHAATTTPFKAIAIKIPPQAPDDVHPVP